MEQARRALEEQAAELALTSKYKSEFLANMSHELRTPLNSILILGQQLAENGNGNLTAKQVEFARNIHSSGSDLFNLITDILDLSKIESGTVTVDAEDISFTSLRDSIERNFRHIADAKNLPFDVEFHPNMPRVDHDGPEAPAADPEESPLQRLQVHRPRPGDRGRRAGRRRAGCPGPPRLEPRPRSCFFAINDTGIGIAAEKQKLIFEAFQQADAGTSRKYGGTGLGLSISPRIGHACWAAKSACKARQARAARSRYILPVTFVARATATNTHAGLGHDPGAYCRRRARKSSPTTASRSNPATRPC